MVFPTKNDQHLGCEMGVPPFKETPIYVYITITTAPLVRPKPRPVPALYPVGTPNTESPRKRRVHASVWCIEPTEPYIGPRQRWWRFNDLTSIGWDIYVYLWLMTYDDFWVIKRQHIETILAGHSMWRRNLAWWICAYIYIYICIYIYILNIHIHVWEFVFCSVIWAWLKASEQNGNIFKQL